MGHVRRGARRLDRDVGAFGVKSYGYRRTSPSGGSLQTVEPYLVNLTISGLPVGVYHYHSIDHRLTRIDGELPAADLGPLLASQNFANDLGFAVFMVARFDKMWWKYPHSRSYRVALMDVGHLSQTFHLACTGYGLKTWLTAAFYDEEIARRLRLDPTRQADADGRRRQGRWQRNRPRGPEGAGHTVAPGRQPVTRAVLQRALDLGLAQFAHPCSALAVSAASAAQRNTRPQRARSRRSPFS